MIATGLSGLFGTFVLAGMPRLPHVVPAAAYLVTIAWPLAPGYA